jgi:Helix-turn-helix domain
MKRTQADRVLDWMATGKGITPLQALKRFGCLRLGARIHQLKKDGHRIRTDLVRKNGKTVAEYRLNLS